MMKKSTKGFTIFFAALVGSLALAVGIAIYDLLVREIALSQIASQSQYAVYAADTGAECALYWDFHYTDSDQSAFATSSAGGGASAGQGVICNGQDIFVATNNILGTGSDLSVVKDISSAKTTFYVSMGTSPTDPYAMVEVSKNGNPSQTTIISHGYNRYDAKGVVKVERTWRVSY